MVWFIKRKKIWPLPFEEKAFHRSEVPFDSCEPRPAILHTTFHIQCWHETCHVLRVRHSAKTDCTIMYAHHTAHSTLIRDAARQLSCARKTGMEHKCWQADNSLTLSWTSRWTLTEEFACLLCVFPLLANTKTILIQGLIESHYISHKATRAGRCPCSYFRACESRPLELLSPFFDKMRFIFSCVISNQSLRVLISVPRSLLLLTWETDTFLNAYNCLEEPAWPFYLSSGHTGLQQDRLDYTEVLWCLNINPLQLVCVFTENARNRGQEIQLRESGETYSPLRAMSYLNWVLKKRF